MTPRRELGAVVALCALGAGILLLAAGRTWVTVSQRLPAGTAAQVAASGNSLQPVTATGLVALAAVVAVLATRRAGRAVVGVLLVLDAALAAWLVRAFFSELGRGLRVGGPEGLIALSGRSGTDVSAWPWVALAGAVLVACSGLLVLTRGRRWPGMSGRYDRSAAQPRARTPDQAMWDALDKGDDPTR